MEYNYFYGFAATESLLCKGSGNSNPNLEDIGMNYMIKTKDKVRVTKVIDWQKIPINKTPTEVLKEWQDLGRTHKKKVSVA